MNDVTPVLTRFAGCVISDDSGKILLMHRTGKDEWELPGGSIEPDEPAEVAAARQLYEELGVDVEIEQSMGTTSIDRDDQSYEFEWFKATILQGEPAPKESLECDAIRYFSRGELRTMSNLSPTLDHLLSEPEPR